MDKHLEAAKICLEKLRKGTPHAEAYLKTLARHALAAELSLGDLGTDTDELYELRLSGSRIRAMKLLRALREDGHDRTDFVRVILELVAEAGCTLEDIGTTESELAGFSGGG